MLSFRHRGWFDIKAIDFEENKEDREGIETSAGIVHDLFAAENQAGMPFHKLFVGGFSQGGGVRAQLGVGDETLRCLVDWECRGDPKTTAGLLMDSADAKQSNQIESNQIESNRIEWNPIEANQIKPNQTKSNQAKPNQRNANPTQLDPLKSHQI